MSISFTLNGDEITYNGDDELSLLSYLREHCGILSPKDGCSGQAACGACMVEMNGNPTLSCVTPMKKVDGAQVVTIEGFPPDLRHTLASAFVNQGAVQCGFCTPGFLTRTKILLQHNPNPSEQEIKHALRFNLCRCTGYIKIIEAIQTAARTLTEGKTLALNPPGVTGKAQPKYKAFEKALGRDPFVADILMEGMVFGALKFSHHPRALVKSIDISAARSVPGVLRVFTAQDIPGKRINGLIVKDWPLMVKAGEITRYIGDVLAGVVARSEALAREAVKLIKVEYRILPALTQMIRAENNPIKIHEKGNILETSTIIRGKDADLEFQNSAFGVSRTFQTQRIEHAFLETEAALAYPLDEGIGLYSQGQGVYEEREQIAGILDVPKEKVKITQVSSGGGFGGKEDLTVQGHAALFAYLLKKPVKVRLTRDESMIMHPKRHPMILEYQVGCDEDGKLRVLKARIIGDTGAYASVGMKVLERAAGHATGAYHIPNVDIIAKSIYTNNIPCGAMRGFGVNQAIFAMESCLDELCEKGGFDRWQFRYDNALVEGSMTATGQVLTGGVGVRQTLLALKDDFYAATFAGLACGIKNCGIGNGMNDFAEVKIEIHSPNHVILHHGWTEMGQGIHTVAQQVLFQETGIDPSIIEVRVSTVHESPAGMTTTSRGTSLLGNAILEASKKLKTDLEQQALEDLVGNIYSGRWSFDQSTKPGAKGKVITHYSYSYASQLVILDNSGKIETVIAAHDAGKVINPALFQGQIQGAVHMGLGYALSEDFPMKKGKPLSTKLRDLGILKIKDMPRVQVKAIEVTDPLGPYGAKGIGEIGLVPTAAAVANAFYQFDGIRRTRLPLKNSTEGE